MSTAPCSKQQIGAIHAAKANAALDDDTYRDILARLTGRRSSRDLNSAEAAKVLNHLNGLSKSVKGSVRMSGTYAGKLRALWLTGYNLGVVADRRDTALLAFVERQTKISHPDWWTDAATANRAIEGLKDWIGREAGIDWSACRTTRQMQEAAYFALHRRLTEVGLTSHMPDDTSRFIGTTFIEWMRTGGQRLRHAQKKRAAAA